MRALAHRGGVWCGIAAADRRTSLLLRFQCQPIGDSIHDRSEYPTRDWYVAPRRCSAMDVWGTRRPTTFISRMARRLKKGQSVRICLWRGVGRRHHQTPPLSLCFRRPTHPVDRGRIVVLRPPPTVPPPPLAQTRGGPRRSQKNLNVEREAGRTDSRRPQRWSSATRSR